MITVATIIITTFDVTQDVYVIEETPKRRCIDAQCWRWDWRHITLFCRYSNKFYSSTLIIC